MKTAKSKIKMPLGSRIFDVFNVVFLGLLAFSLNFLRFSH